MTRLAIVGARGIANYGGFESYVSELAPRLAARGLSVTCSCEKSKSSGPETFRGVRLSYFPFEPPSRYGFRKVFEVIYDIYFILRSDYDIVYGLGVAAGPAYLIPRLLGKTSIVNIDGLEWARQKYTRFEKLLLKLLYLLAVSTATKIAIDNTRMRQYVPKRLNEGVVYAPNGVVCEESLDKTRGPIVLKGERLEPGEYWLVVARLEPENNIEMIIRGYAASGSERHLVIVGNASSREYMRELSGLVRRLGLSERVVFTGGIYNRVVLDRLRKGCFAYLHGHSVGGTNPSLLEIMSLSKIILAFGSPFNREVGGDAILYFANPGDLTPLIKKVESDQERYTVLGRRAAERVSRYYDWNQIITDYVVMFTVSA